MEQEILAHSAHFLGAYGSQVITEILAFQVLGGREVKYFSCQKWFRALNCRASYITRYHDIAHCTWYKQYIHFLFAYANTNILIFCAAVCVSGFTSGHDATSHACHSGPQSMFIKIMCRLLYHGSIVIASFSTGPFSRTMWIPSKNLTYPLQGIFWRCSFSQVVIG